MTQRPEFEGDEAGRCGGCGSRRLTVTQLPDKTTLHGYCLECERLQEVEVRDWPLSEMCDNCAFRKGSPERADPYRWAEVQATLDSGSAFHCHKGLALDAQSGAFAAPDPSCGDNKICAGWLATYAARFKRAAA